ncbi:MAG: hypothetical protein IJU05_08640 [Schwartzia sp.]|nr:hypothetical protein [Schwartzia sp. (in: firmicutes)]
MNVLKDLRDKADAIDWNRDARKIYYVLFGVHGFTPELQEAAATRRDVLLVG